MLQTWQRLKGFVICAGNVFIIVSVLLSTMNSFSLDNCMVNNINGSALASIRRVFTPLLEPIGVQGDHWQAAVGLI